MWHYRAGAVLETLSVNEENLDHHYTRHERSRSSRKEDERLPWRKAKRCVWYRVLQLGACSVQEPVRDWCLSFRQSCYCQ